LKKILIAAVSRNNVIGMEAKKLWHSPEELKHFKKITIGFPVIMGRKTWEVLRKPLPGRLNIVITRDKKYSIPFRDVVIFNSINQAFDFCRSSVYEKIFVIGGGEIYSQSINESDEIILSEMNMDAEGDIYFPEIDGNLWVLDSSELHEEFTVHNYIRKKY
jgi:dihydrofolate reductase